MQGVRPLNRQGLIRISRPGITVASQLVFIQSSRGCLTTIPHDSRGGECPGVRPRASEGLTQTSKQTKEEKPFLGCLNIKAWRHPDFKMQLRDHPSWKAVSYSSNSPIPIGFSPEKVPQLLGGVTFYSSPTAVFSSTDTYSRGLIPLIGCKDGEGDRYQGRRQTQVCLLSPFIGILCQIC